MISFIPEEVGRCRELAFVEPAVINVFTGTHGTEAGGGGGDYSIRPASI